MYRAKSAGEGGFERYDPEMHVDLVERLQLEADLRRAIAANQFVLHFQPIVSLGNRGLVGAEALVRWQHPSRGLMAPAFSGVVLASVAFVGLVGFVAGARRAAVVSQRVPG
jgi:predicted signal transduction protein with EAL and GGDEF domain